MKWITSREFQEHRQTTSELCRMLKSLSWRNGGKLSSQHKIEVATIVCNWTNFVFLNHFSVFCFTWSVFDLNIFKLAKDTNFCFPKVHNTWWQFLVEKICCFFLDSLIRFFHNLEVNNVNLSPCTYSINYVLVTVPTFLQCCLPQESCYKQLTRKGARERSFYSKL